MGDYAGRVNLIFESIERFQGLLIREYSKVNRFKSSTILLEKSRNHKEYRGTGIRHFKGETSLVKLEEIYFIISEFGSSKTLFVYQKVDGFETKGWVLLQKFKEYLEDKELRNSILVGVDRIVPITWYKDDIPVEPWRLSDLEVDKFFSKRLHFKIGEKVGVWENVRGEEIENPLISSSMLVMGVPF